MTSSSGIGGFLFQSRAARIVAIVSIWALIAALFATQNFIGSHYVTRPLDWSRAIGTAGLVWLLRAAGAVPAFWLARRFPFGRGGVIRALLVHVPASAALGGVEQALYTAALQNIGWFNGVIPSPVEVHMNIVIYWAVVGLAHGAMFYADSRRNAVAGERLRAQLAAARLDLLRSQLQPHFLFNTLNDIAELMHEDTERADAMLASLSELLRSSLRNPSERDVTLGEELDFLNRYLSIVRMRFQDRLNVRVDVAEALRGARVPSLILQPIVENAVRHGVARRSGPGTVVVAASQRGERLRLEVSDDGPGLDRHDGRQGVGLTNTRDRLREEFGDDFLLELVEPSGGGATAIIELPLARSTAAVSV